MSLCQSGGALSSRGPAVGNVMLPEASVHLPVAGLNAGGPGSFRTGGRHIPATACRDWDDGTAGQHPIQGDASDGNRSHRVVSVYIVRVFRFVPLMLLPPFLTRSRCFRWMRVMVCLQLMSTQPKRTTFHRTRKRVYRLRRLIRCLLRLRFR